METPGSHRLRPRISLLTLLLLTATVASWVTTAGLWREIGPLRREVQSYRDRLGVIRVEDPGRVYAIQEPHTSESRSIYRLYTPEGAPFILRWRAGGLAPASTGKAEGQRKLPAGRERLIEVRYEHPVDRTTDAIAPQAILLTGNASEGEEAGRASSVQTTLRFRPEWLQSPLDGVSPMPPNASSGADRIFGVHRSLVVGDADKPLVLHSRRLRNDEDWVCGGFEVWIEPAP